jgi:hypothetical protein
MAIAEVGRTTTSAQQTRSAGHSSAAVASVALVPVVATPRRLAPIAQGLTRPDPSFVTHLIAMAELSPQTRTRRRAAPGDVQAAYLSVANQDRTVTQPGARTLRIA